ncbi:MAG: C40 family peptidase, partial [Halocynthiibacter sp.]
RRDGYVGYLPVETLGAAGVPTHWVAARASHLYCAADFKQADRATLSFGARLCITATDGQFGRTAEGDFVPMQHLRGVDEALSDLAAVAEMFLGTPYLWGGNSADGIDCSGLVQAACLACAIPCPRDSDQQQQHLGRALSPRDSLRRGDVIFWKGHVGLMASAGRLIHANIHHMAVAAEPLEAAIDRIAKSEFGAVTARRRPVA